MRVCCEMNVRKFVRKFVRRVWWMLWMKVCHSIVVIKYCIINCEWKFCDQVLNSLLWKNCESMWWKCVEELFHRLLNEVWNKCWNKCWNKVCVVLKLCWSCVTNLSLNLSWWDSWIISHTIYHESFVKGLWWNCCESIVVMNVV